MKNTFGNNLTITLFGESHGSEIGIVLDGIAPGIKIDNDFIKEKLSLRRPSLCTETDRREMDEFKIVSGEFNSYTTGTPLCIIIKNSDVKSEIYDKTKNIMRPGHADYTAMCKYHGFQDYRGGGHFSGRLTAPLVAAGAIMIRALENKGIFVGTHIKKIEKIEDREFKDVKSDILKLNLEKMAVLDSAVAEKMIEKIQNAKNEGDSVGGILETAVYGVPCGLGEPWFDSMESMISHAMFSIPAVKGIEFGEGFNFANMSGSEANDPFFFENNKIITTTNNNGGINGGITNGNNIIFRCVVKPTPSISKEQDTVDIYRKENVKIKISGRHDSAIVQRIAPVIDSLTAFVIADALTGRYGTDYLGDKI